MFDLSGFVNYLESKGKSDPIIKNYKSGVNKFYKYLVRQGREEQDNYTMTDIIKFIKYRGLKGRCISSLVQPVPAINAYSSFIKRNLYLELRDIPISLKDKQFKDREFVILCKNAQDNIYHYASKTWKKRNIAMVLLMLEAGLKISELKVLNKEDLVERNGMYSIRIKSLFTRDIRITQKLYVLIQESYQARQDNENAMFTAHNGTRINDVSIQYALKSFDLTPTVLRDTYIYNQVISEICIYGQEMNLINTIYDTQKVRFIEF